MYGVTKHTTRIDRALMRRIAADRKDGDFCKLSRRTPPRSCRAVFTSVDQVGATAKYLMPGGVMLARSVRPVTHENSIEEKKKLLAAGLDACGWSEDIHWGIREPHERWMPSSPPSIDRWSREEADRAEGIVGGRRRRTTSLHGEAKIVSAAYIGRNGLQQVVGVQALYMYVSENFFGSWRSRFRIKIRASEA
jgi:hypothetical protein